MAGDSGDMDSEERTPVDQVLDALVFAPVGIFLAARDELRRELPKLAERGREQVVKQVGLARMMGHYAAEELQKDAKRRVSRLAETVNTLRDPIPEVDADAGAPASAAPAPAPAAPAPTAASPAPAPRAPTAPMPAAEPAGLGIPGYGALSASQVVQRLAGLSAAQLEAVRHYEGSNRGRKTILGRIAQLQSEASS